jgi:hypothetical protein
LKFKVFPVHGLKAYIGIHVYLRSVSALDGGEWSTWGPGRVTPEKKPPHSRDRRLDGLQSWSGRFGEEIILLPLSRIEPRLVQFVAYFLYYLHYPGSFKTYKYWIQNLIAMSVLVTHGAPYRTWIANLFESSLRWRKCYCMPHSQSCYLVFLLHGSCKLSFPNKQTFPIMYCYLELRCQRRLHQLTAA